jgi:hypothetical protein
MSVSSEEHEIHFEFNNMCNTHNTCLLSFYLLVILPPLISLTILVLGTLGIFILNHVMITRKYDLRNVAYEELPIVQEKHCVHKLLFSWDLLLLSSHC